MTTAMSASEGIPTSSALRPARTSPATTWLRRYLLPFLTAIAVLGLSVMLVLTIYFTLFDLQWIAFLLGVLCAAVLGLVSQSIKAQWLIARRLV